MAAQGVDQSSYAHSMVVGTLAPTNLGTLRQADGQEHFTDLDKDAAAGGKA